MSIPAEACEGAEMSDAIRFHLEPDHGHSPKAIAEAQQEVMEAIRRTGDSSLLGDWSQRIIAKDPAAPARPAGDRITLDVREYLDAFDPSHLQAQIAAFKKDAGATATMSTVEIRTRLLSILHPGDLRSAVIPFSSVTMPAGSHSYRVRANIVDPSDVKTVGGVWSRPDGGTPGRVNRPGQRILYLAANSAHLALVEAKPRDGEYVAVSQFINTEPLILIRIQDMDDPHRQLSVSQTRKLKALADFFNWLFNYSGTDPENPRYEAAQVIALDFHILPVEALGWGYQSVLLRSPFAFNIALDADRAKRVLRLVNTQIYHYKAGPTPSLTKHSSLIPAKQNVEPATALVPGPAAQFEWQVPPTAETKMRGPRKIGVSGDIYGR